MVKSKRLYGKRRHRRTSLEIEEEHTRTLYIRISHTIKDVNEIKNLFFGNFRVKLPRQSGRYCHVIFSNIEEKVKNMKAIKKKVIDGKRIYVGPPKPINLERKKPKHKKIVFPEPKEESKADRYLFLSNIPIEANASEIREAFPGSVTIGLFKNPVNGERQGKIKMSSVHSCLRYLKNESEWPIIHGKKITVALSKKTNNNNKIKKRTEKLNIIQKSDEAVNNKSIPNIRKNNKNNNKIGDDVVKDVEDEEDEEDEENEENEDEIDEEDEEDEDEEDEEEEDDEDDEDEDDEDEENMEKEENDKD